MAAESDGSETIGFPEFLNQSKLFFYRFLKQYFVDFLNTRNIFSTGIDGCRGRWIRNHRFPRIPGSPQQGKPTRLRLSGQ